MYRPSNKEITKIVEDHGDWVTSKFRGKPVGKPGSFSGMDLSHRKLSGIDLRDVDFSGANCRYCDFSYSSLEGASFCDTEMYGAQFTDARIFTTSSGYYVYVDTKAKDKPALTVALIDRYNRNTLINLDDCHRLFWSKS